MPPTRSSSPVATATAVGPGSSSSRPIGRGSRTGAAHTLTVGRIATDEHVELRLTPDGTGDGVLATRDFAAGETVMVGIVVERLDHNDSHATQVGVDTWVRHGGLGPKVNHSCDPNSGVRLNASGAFDFVARQPIAKGAELTFDYAMRNLTVDHFPSACLCGGEHCRGAVTGWKDLPADRKAAYGELVAPYLRELDRQTAASGN